MFSRDRRRYRLATLARYAWAYSVRWAAIAHVGLFCLLSAGIDAQVVAPGALDSLPPVTVLVNGHVLRQSGVIPPGADVIISNGFISLRRNALLSDQRAGIVATLIARGASQARGTSVNYGDYTYVGTSVVSDPTYVDVVTLSKNEAVVTWGFGRHWLRPRSVGLNSNAPDQPYPFRKTVWLRRGQSGYFTLVEPLVHYSQPIERVEHEIGFGGLWGPATVTTGHDSVSTSSLSKTRSLSHGAAMVDAALFARDGDPVTRILVPLDPSQMIVPKFTASDYGSVWILRYSNDAYGGYLYMAFGVPPASPRQVCQFAWATAPTALRMRGASAAALAECGTP
jgi:hypothetical protein